MPILLFDIDGTLVRTGGAGKAAMEAGLLAEFGLDAKSATRSNTPAAPTARSAATCSRIHGIDPTPANQVRLQNAYLSHLPNSLHARAAARSAPASPNC